jgi:hypothetical protein
MTSRSSKKQKHGNTKRQTHFGMSHGRVKHDTYVDREWNTQTYHDAKAIMNP